MGRRRRRRRVCHKTRAPFARRGNAPPAPEKKRGARQREREKRGEKRERRVSPRSADPTRHTCPSETNTRQEDVSRSFLRIPERRGRPASPARAPPVAAEPPTFTLTMIAAESCSPGGRDRLVFSKRPPRGWRIFKLLVTSNNEKREPLCPLLKNGRLLPRFQGASLVRFEKKSRHAVFHFHNPAGSTLYLDTITHRESVLFWKERKPSRV